MGVREGERERTKLHEHIVTTKQQRTIGLFGSWVNQAYWDVFLEASNVEDYDLPDDTPLNDPFLYAFPYLLRYSR